MALGDFFVHTRNAMEIDMEIDDDTDEDWEAENNEDGEIDLFEYL